MAFCAPDSVKCGWLVQVRARAKWCGEFKPASGAEVEYTYVLGKKSRPEDAFLFRYSNFDQDFDILGIMDYEAPTRGSGCRFCAPIVTQVASDGAPIEVVLIFPPRRLPAHQCLAFVRHPIDIARTRRSPAGKAW